MARYTALVVDDKPDQLKLVSVLLSSMDIQAVAAGSADQGLKLVFESQPSKFDFLLLDIHMPNMGGIEMAKQARAKGYTGAIFAFTAHATMDGKKRGEGSGINAFLSKMTLKKELLEALIAEHVKKL